MFKNKAPRANTRGLFSACFGGADKVFLIFSLLFIFSLVLSYLVIFKLSRMRSSPPKSTTITPTNPVSRLPALAGSYYPGNSKELDSLVNRLLSEAPLLSVRGKLKILLVPHAGMEYSGAVAAAGFKQIQGQDYRRIIILGASHRAFFNSAAVFNKGNWETPLGKIMVDEDLAEKILDQREKIIVDTQLHIDEPSLEIELPFLQKSLKDFKIVPILLGQVAKQTLEALSKKIAENLDEQTLLVISSDLSHYPSWEIANKVDSETIAAILTGKAATFMATLTKAEEEHYPGLDTGACGQEAIEVGLRVAELLNLAEIKKIKYANSGDIPAGKEGVTPDKSRVVGYGAIGFWEILSDDQLDQKDQKEALELARKTLEDYLSGQPAPTFSPQSPLLLKPRGAFVTLRKNGELRGCIGEFEPKEPLYQVIRQMAIAAATKDPRFSPVTASELKDIKIEISVMTPKQKINDWRKIKLGVDGVVVQYIARSGVFLPQVATETGWSLEEFLGQLCSQKAGLSPNCYQDPATNLYIFQAQVFEER